MATKVDKQTVTKEDVGTVPANAVVPRKASPPVPLAMQTENPAAAFLEEVKGPRESAVRISLITIDHKAAGFKMPSGELAAEVSGYPINYFRTRRYYKKPPQAGQKGEPPDCWSADDKVPHETSVEKMCDTCSSCPMNQFGTARDGRSKACGTFTWVFLLNPQFGEMPIAAVVAPPSSLRPLFGTKFESGYFSQAQAKARAYEIVWTTFRLKQFGGGVEYSVLDPVMGEVQTDPTSQKFLAQCRNKALVAMDALRGKTVDANIGVEPEVP
jgi:hypothetical protein